MQRGQRTYCNGTGGYGTDYGCWDPAGTYRPQQGYSGINQSEMRTFCICPLVPTPPPAPAAFTFGHSQTMKISGALSTTDVGFRIANLWLGTAVSGCGWFLVQIHNMGAGTNVKK